MSEEKSTHEVFVANTWRNLLASEESESERRMELKGKSAVFDARVMQAGPGGLKFY